MIWGRKGVPRVELLAWRRDGGMDRCADVGGRGADHDGIFARLDHKAMATLIVECQLVGRHGERDGLLLSRPERDALEAAQLLRRALDTRRRGVRVELDHLITDTRAGVFHV